MRPQSTSIYDELKLQTNVVKSIDENHQDSTIQPIFSIPIHETTHAPSNEYLEGEDSFLSEGRLAGRPLPTPDVEVEGVENSLSISESRLSSHRDGFKRYEATSSPLLRSNTLNLKLKATSTQKRLSRRFSRRKNQSSARASLRLEETPFPGLIIEEGDMPLQQHREFIPEESAVLAVTNDTTSSPNTARFDPISAGRFPRWRGWLEKRAMEKQPGHIDTEPSIRRKKSWGAGINDEDAIPDDEEEEIKQDARSKDSLYTCYMGSRFISHLPSMPLCSAYLDLPPPVETNGMGQKLLRRQIPEALKRKVLLVGTAEGLFAAEICQKSRKIDPHNSIRYRQVWKGTGVYQMSILTSILLALCSSAKEQRKKSIGSINTHTNTSNHNLIGTPFSLKEQDTSYIPSSHFGAGAGGGPSKLTPSSGTGVVHMWSLEALRRMVAYALDGSDDAPVDMSQSRSETSKDDRRRSLTGRIRRAWASLGDPSSDRKARRRSRQAISLAESKDTIMQPPKVNKFCNDFSELNQSMNQFSTDSKILVHRGEFGRLQSSPEESIDESGYEEALRLAQNSVTIKLPSGSSASLSGQPVDLGQTDSLTSLFSDEAMSATSVSNLGHGSSTSNYHSSSKGVSFFSVFEAKAEVGAYGTWYMALATSKSIYLYEAAKPSAGDETRSWVFVKEFYTPLPAKAIAFTYSQILSDNLNRSQTQSKRKTLSSQSNNQSMQIQQQKVNSSAYSSVFRSHYDLSLFVTFGKKAVLIRVSDASVKEVELETTGKANASMDHGLTKSAVNSSSANKRRSLSVDLMTSETRREQWIGLEKVISEVAIRRRHQDEDDPAINGVKKFVEAPILSSPERDDDDDDEEEEEKGQQGTVILEGYRGLGVTLQDVPLSKVTSPTASSLLHHAIVSSPTIKEEPSQIVHAKLALFSKGKLSHIYPLPLPFDIGMHRPLNVIQWKEPPIGVTAWSRIVGLERDLSSGPISISTLGGQHMKQAEASPNIVHLHVNITAVAMFSNAIEMKRVKVKVQVTLPFAFDRNSELELQPLSKDDDSPEIGYEGAGSEKMGEADERDDVIESVRQEVEYLSGILDVAGKSQNVIKPWQALGDAGIWAFDWRGADDYRLFYVGARV